MPVKVFANTIADPERRKIAEQAVLDGIGNRPEELAVTLQELADGPKWFLNIDSPDGFELKYEFFGPDEQNGDFIRRTVSQVFSPPVHLS